MSAKSSTKSSSKSGARSISEKSEVDALVNLLKAISAYENLQGITDEFRAVVTDKLQQQINTVMSNFERLPFGRRFEIYVQACIRLYLKGELLTSKSSFISNLKKRFGPGYQQDWYRDQKLIRRRYSSSKTGLSTSDPAQSNLLHVFFDIIALLDQDRVSIEEVNRQFDFVENTLDIENSNPLLLVLSIFHNKLQCRNAIKAPIGDQFTDLEGKIRLIEEEGPYRLVTKKCSHSMDCFFLHNAQKICLDYILTGSCSYPMRYLSNDSISSEFSSVCPYAHVCLVCHLIQRQAMDFVPRSKVTTHRLPCHLRSATETDFVTVMEEKIRKLTALERIESAYIYHQRYCEPVTRFTRKYCEWCGEDGLTRTYPESLLQIPFRLPLSDQRTEADIEREIFFGDASKNPEFFRQHDLLIRIGDYLHPWEYNPYNLNSPVASKLFRIHTNTALFPGMCYPDPTLIRPITTTKRLHCSVTESLNQFMQKILELTVTTSDQRDVFYSMTGHRALSQGYTIESNAILSAHQDRVYFYPRSIDALSKLVSIVAALPEYQVYMNRCGRASALPRHISEKRGNIEPPAAIWNPEERSRSDLFEKLPDPVVRKRVPLKSMPKPISLADYLV